MYRNGKSQESKISKKSLLRDGVKHLDIMAEKFKFNYERQRGKYRTRLGGCVTLIVAVLAVILLVFTSSQYFDTSSPVVTTTRELSTSAQSFNVVGNDLFTGTGLTFRNVLQPIFPNLITMKAQLIQKTYNPQKNTTKTQILKTYSYISCSQITDQSLINLVKKLIENADLNQFICPNFEEVDNNVTLSSDQKKFTSTYISVKVFPCSLPDPSQCYPIDTGYNLRLVTAKNSNLLSPSNYEDPVAFRWIITNFVIDVTRTAFYRDTLQLNKIVDDRSFLAKPKTKAEYALFLQLTTDSLERDPYQQYCIPVMIDSGECQEYLEFVYEMDNEVVITKRRYKKIPALLGEFGGMLKLLTTAFVILSVYYTTAIKLFLFNQVFGMEKSKATKILKRAVRGLVIQSKKSQGRNKKGYAEVRDEGSHQEPKTRILLEKNKSGQIIESSLKTYRKRLINSKIDVVELVQKMSLADLLKSASLEKHHKILLPLVILGANLCKNKLRRASASDLKEVSKKPKNGQNEKVHFPEKKDQDREANYLKANSIEVLRQRTGDLSIDQKNYAIIKQLRPQNSLEGIINKQILSYLSTVYEQE